MDFLEQCKVRLIEAHKRVQITQQELQGAQSRHALAMQEANSLQVMIQLETARTQQNNTVSVQAAPQAVPAELPAPQPEVNKTDMIRELLRQHPAGMAPTEIWQCVKNQLTHRAYLYSVLGRLKDREEVYVRRKKYFLKNVPRPAEEKEQAVVH